MLSLHYNTFWDPEAGATGFVYSGPGEDITADTVEELVSKYRAARTPEGIQKTDAFVYDSATRRSTPECIGRVDGDRFIPIPAGKTMLTWLASLALSRLASMPMGEEEKAEMKKKICAGDFHRMSFFGESRIGKWFEKLAQKLPEPTVTYEQLCLFDI